MGDTRPEWAKVEATKAAEPHDPNKDASSPIAVMLMANETNGVMLNDIQKMRQMLRSKKVLIPFEEVDGTGSDEHKELRGRLFDISFQTGTYPQLIIKDGEDYEYVGILEELNE